MRVLVLASQKGGAGKTTLAGHIAVEAMRAGAGFVAIMDTDPQGGLAGWWNAREDMEPIFFPQLDAGLQATLDQFDSPLRGPPELLIIDTPPTVGPAIRTALAVADLVVIPVAPSPHDLRAVGATVEMVRAAERPMAFVVNRAQQRARITVDTVLALSQHGPVCPTVLHHRNDFATSMVDGRTVGELDATSRSALEVRDLWAYLDQRLTQETAQHGRKPKPQPRHPRAAVSRAKRAGGAAR